MELFDVIDSKGNPAGQIVSREKCPCRRNSPQNSSHMDYSEKRGQSADSFTETLTKQGFFSGKI